MEEFRQIKDFENYEISNRGNVKNVKTNKILKNNIGSRGYYKVNLCKDKIQKTLNIHRLVAFTFKTNLENKCATVETTHLLYSAHNALIDCIAVIHMERRVR